MIEGELSIRQFRFPEDYQAVIELWANAGAGIHLRRSDQPEEIQKKLLRDPDLFLLGEYKGNLIAAVLGGFDGRRGMMYHLAVASEYRRRGFARQIVAELERRLRAKGCIKYYLLVTEDNDEAMRFYEADGWDRMELHAYGKDL